MKLVENIAYILRERPSPYVNVCQCVGYGTGYFEDLELLRAGESRLGANIKLQEREIWV
jgi:hypothetical protein